MYLSIKYKLKPTNSQILIFEEWLNTTRYIYNIALEEKITAYKTNKTNISKFEQYNQLPEIKKEFKWIKNVYSQVLQETLDRLHKSYDSFFKGRGFPKFKKKKFWNSFTFKSDVKLENKHIILPKIGKVKYYNSKEVKNIKTATIIKENNNWFISITYEVQEKPLLIDNNQAIGIDVGIVHHSYLSNGLFYDNNYYLKNSLKQLRILNRKLSRQNKGSYNYKKTINSLNKLYTKIKNQRKDFNHKLSTIIVNSYSSIYVENLQISNMIKLNSTLSRNMLDNAFYQYRLMLEYKSKLNGKYFKAVPPQYTSQTCTSCNSIDKKSRISQSEFVCTSCGYVSNADELGAENIKRKGITFSTQSKPLG